MEPSPVVLARIADAKLRAAYADTSRRGDTPLMRAAADGDADAVRAALAAGADVNAMADGAESALANAVAAGHVDIVELLLAAGADVRTRARHDRSMLHLAARQDSVALVRMLVDAGARIVSDAYQESPIDAAIAHGREAIAETLLELPMQDGVWQSAFGHACERGAMGVLRHLWVRYETRVLELGSWVLMRAADGGHVEAIHFLVDLGFPVNHYDVKEERSPLMHAVGAGHLAAAAALIDRGADVNDQTEWFVTPLGIAIGRRDTAMIELLKSRGAEGEVPPEIEHAEKPSWQRADEELEQAVADDDIDGVIRILDSLGRATTILLEASQVGANHAVALALAAGGNPLQDNLNSISRAVRYGHGRAVRMMLAGGVPVDASLLRWACSQPDVWILRDLLDAHGGAATTKLLDDAATSGRSHHVALLLDHGARLDEADARPLTYAAQFGDLRVVELLLDHHARSDWRDAALLAAVRWPHVVDAMLRRGADPRARDRDGQSLLHLVAGERTVSIEPALALVGDLLESPGRLGWTPLHQATMSGRLETIEKLLAIGARIDAKGERGDTPLHLAASYPRPYLIETLLAAGAPVDAVDNEGATPLHNAMAAGAETVSKLLAAGADPHVRDRQGRTPLAYGESLLAHWGSEYERRKGSVEALRAHLAALQ